MIDLAEQTTSIKSGELSSPLASKLLRRMLSTYLAIAVMLTSIQLGLEFINEKDRLSEDIGGTVESFRPVISTALWNVDETSYPTFICPRKSLLPNGTPNMRNMA